MDSMVDTFDSLIYSQRQALHAWKKSVGIVGPSVTPPIERMVWELLLLCADNIASPSIDTDEEITRVAYDLAAELLKSLDIRALNTHFRDALVNAVLANVPSSEDATRKMIRFSNLVSDAFRDAYADRLKRTITAQRSSRVAEELHMAKQIQERLLPTPEKLPTIPGFQVAGRVIPAMEVGGDYWSVKYNDDGIVTLKLADISGHGIAAATLVAAVKFISGGYYRGSASAHEVMERTNRVLARETPVEILVTMVYAWLHPETGQLDVVNAGHEPVFLCSSGVCTDIRPTGTVLGFAETNSYDEVTFKLRPGDIFFTCSDGIMEAGIGEPFGMRRIKNLVLENRDRTASEIADAVIAAVTEYAGQPHDDMSVVVLKTIDEPSS